MVLVALAASVPGLLWYVGAGRNAAQGEALPSKDALGQNFATEHEIGRRSASDYLIRVQQGRLLRLALYLFR